LALFKPNVENPMFRHFKIAHLLREMKPLIRYLKARAAYLAGVNEALKRRND